MGKLKVHFTHEYCNHRFFRLDNLASNKHTYSACGRRMHVPETRLLVSDNPEVITCFNCQGSFEYKLAKEGELNPGFRFKSGETKVTVKPRWVYISMPQVAHVYEDMRQNLKDVSWGANFRYLKRRGVYAYTRDCDADKVFLRLMDRFGLEFESEQERIDIVNSAYAKDDWEAIEYLVNCQFGL